MAAVKVVDFSEMYGFVLERLKLPSGTSAVTAITNRVKQAINVAYETLITMEDWEFAHREGLLQTKAEYTTGTASVTKDNGTVTLSAAYGSNLEAGMHIKFTGDDPHVYPILSIAGDPAITLGDSNTSLVYMGDTNATISFKAWKHIYALNSDFGEPVNFHNFFRDRTIRPISLREFRQMYTQDPTPGDPRYYTLTYRDATTLASDPKVMFYPPPDDNNIYPYDYKIKVTLLDADTDETILPDKYVVAICWLALADLYYHVKNDPTGAQIASDQATLLISKMAGTYAPQKGRPGVKPDIRRYLARMARKRISTARYHLGEDLFGRLS